MWAAFLSPVLCGALYVLGTEAFSFLLAAFGGTAAGFAHEFSAVQLEHGVEACSVSQQTNTVSTEACVCVRIQFLPLPLSWDFHTPAFS